MEEIPEIGSTSSTYSTSTHSTSFVRQMEENEDANLNKSNECEDRPKEKKQKRRKLDQTHEEVCKIVEVLEKDRGPSMDDCMEILHRLLTYEDPQYFVATNALCKRKEYRVLWMGMPSDEERIAWIRSLRKKTLMYFVLKMLNGAVNVVADKYYLVDAAYAHTRGFMAPYRNARYWLNDFRSGGRANTKEEVFNQCHSRLRNIIERAFGVLKSHFPILKRMPSYSFDAQRRIVLACFTLHNFLRKTSINDELFSQYDDEEVQLENSTQNQTPSLDNSFRASEQLFMQKLREQIANQLFSNA
ncbi:hypothetical protein EZV62_008378 [Acer yangbiense]|uniref:DDE Tnp4 domain-containing protein n=1 Tax=Acer yangbiense TaxID=1000413 RepID=A0A5C7ICQ2_9ROSI|nr:hypothetical protein EZV62_008378 [Acer yangbiense]